MIRERACWVNRSQTHHSAKRAVDVEGADMTFVIARATFEIAVVPPVNDRVSLRSEPAPVVIAGVAGSSQGAQLVKRKVQLASSHSEPRRAPMPCPSAHTPLPILHNPLGNAHTPLQTSHRQGRRAHRQRGNAHSSIASLRRRLRFLLIRS